jgi:PAS domain S-box-containing protein
MVSRTLKLSHKALILVAVPLVFEFAFVGTLLSMLDQAEGQVLAEVNAKQQLYCFNSLNYCMNGALKALMGAATVRGPEFKDMFEKSVEPVPEQFKRLDDLLKKDPTRIRQLARLKVLASQLIGKLESLMSEEDTATGLLELQALKPQILEFFTMTSELRKENDRLMHEGVTLQSRQRANFRSLLITFLVFNVVLAVGLALSFNRTTTSRLAFLLDNTKRFAAGNELNPPLAGNDEIAHLDRMFNEMAVTISDARTKEQAVILNAQEVICSLDAEGRFVKVNPASLRMWGHAPENLIGASLLDHVHEGDCESTSEKLMLLMTREPNLSFENRIVGKDGLVDTQWSAHWSETDRSLFCVAHDITDRKQVERVKQEFYSMVSHDLRTPMTSVYGVLKLILAGALGPVDRGIESKLGIAVRNLERLITLINDLLDLEKLESGKMPFEMNGATPETIVTQAVHAVEGFAQQKHIGLVIDNRVTDVIECDTGRLVQVLVNLISNAVKFSPEGSDVHICTHIVDGCVEFRVKDKGRGIPPQYCKLIFERFTQVEARDARRETGTGIGLSVCKLILEAHGGSIGVESEPGVGSEFWFRIPGLKAPVADDETSRDKVAQEMETIRL